MTDGLAERQTVRIGRGLRVYFHDKSPPPPLESVLEEVGANASRGAQGETNVTMESKDPRDLCRAARLIGLIPGIKALEIEIIGPQESPGLLMQAVVLESTPATFESIRTDSRFEIEGAGGSIELDIRRFVVTIGGADPFVALTACRQWDNEPGIMDCRPQIISLNVRH